jgi:hypothetical protein
MAGAIRGIAGRDTRSIQDWGCVKVTSGGGSGAAKPPPNILFWVFLAAKPPETPRKQSLRRSLNDFDDDLIQDWARIYTSRGGVYYTGVHDSRRKGIWSDRH